MATSNFGTPKHGLPLVAEFCDEQDNDWFWEMKEQEIKEFNSDLTWFEVELVAGYYEGAYYNLKWLSDYVDFEDIDDLTDEGTDYFFGETKAEFVKQAKAEFEKAKKFIIDRQESGAIMLEKVATFSNGETIYRKAGNE